MDTPSLAAGLRAFPDHCVPPADSNADTRGNAKRHGQNPLTDTRPNRHVAPDTGTRKHHLKKSPQSHAVGWQGEVEARTRSGAGHAGAGAAAHVRAAAQAWADLSVDEPKTWLSADGGVQAGAGFEQHALAGLAPLRLGDREWVAEPLSMEQRSHGFAGAKASAGVSAGPAHAAGHAEAFAGTKVGGTGRITAGNQRMHIYGDLRAGAGVEASADVGLRYTPEGRTRLLAQGRLGGALGLGGSVGGGVDLDITPAVEAADSLLRPARRALKSLGGSAKRAIDRLADAGKAVGQFFKTVVAIPVHFLKALFS